MSATLQFTVSCLPIPSLKTYKTIILPVAFYRREISSFILREEHRLRTFEKRVLRRIFGSKRGEGSGGWRRLHNEERHNFKTSPNVIRVINKRRM
jgi:hypothetical protein